MYIRTGTLTHARAHNRTRAHSRSRGDAWRGECVLTLRGKSRVAPGSGLLSSGNFGSGLPWVSICRKLPRQPDRHVTHSFLLAPAVTLMRWKDPLSEDAGSNPIIILGDKKRDKCTNFREKEIYFILECKYWRNEG